MLTSCVCEYKHTSNGHTNYHIAVNIEMDCRRIFCGVHVFHHRWSLIAYYYAMSIYINNK